MSIPFSHSSLSLPLLHYIHSFIHSYIVKERQTLNGVRKTVSTFQKNGVQYQQKNQRWKWLLFSTNITVNALLNKIITLF